MLKIPVKQNITDMHSNKKLNQIVTELFTRGRKLKVYLLFIKQFYFAAPNKYQAKFYTFYYKDSNQTITLTNYCIEKPYYILVIDTTLASDNPLCFRRSLLESI